jgi:hypothetical protein
VDGERSEYFRIETGLRQGCVMSPTLFNMYIDNIMKKVTEEMEGGVTVGDELIYDLDFADDVALLGDTWEMLALMVNKMEAVTQEYGINISTAKSEIVHVGRQEEILMVEDVELRNQQLKQVNKFVYLGSVFTNDGRCWPDVERRMAISTTAYNGLVSKLWRRREVSTKVKMRIFNAVILPVMLYGATAWTLTQKEERRLDAWEMKLLRRMLNIRWDDFVRNDDIRCMLNQMPVTWRLRERRLKMYGHLERMDEDRIARRLWKAEMRGRRPVGRPRTRWRGMLERDVDGLNMTVEEAREMTHNRDEWRAAASASCRWPAAGRQ